MKQLQAIWRWQRANCGSFLGWAMFAGWLGLLAAVFFWQLGSTGLIDETEPLFAEAARQMLATGDWLTPYFNGNTRFDKPPLIYWLMAIAYQGLGVNPWAVRLPSALSAIALAGFCGVTLRYFGDACPQSGGKFASKRQLWLSASLGAGLCALNLQTLIWGRTGVSDMLLSACLGLALLCFFWGYAGGPPPQPSLWSWPRPWYLACYGLLALAVLAKGPVGLVLPGLIIFLFLAYTGNLKAVIREMGLVWGGAIFLAIAAPWFALIIRKHGQDYINAFFGYHNLERFTGVVNGHSAPWYFYFVVVLGFLAPWSAYLPLALARVRFWRPSWWRHQPRSAQLRLFAFFWFVGIFGFFSLAVTKLPSYVLPLNPAAAILVALLWSESLTQAAPRRRWGFWGSAIANVVLLFVLGGVFWYSPELLGNDPAISHEGELLQATGLPARAGAIWLVAGLMALGLLLRPNGRRWLFLPNLGGLLALIWLVALPLLFFVDRTRQLPLREVARAIPQVQQPHEEIWMVGFNKPSVVFYARRSLHFFKTVGRAEEYLAALPATDADARILLIGRAKELERLGLHPSDYQVLEKQGVYFLVRVAPALLKQRYLEEAASEES